jgi:uncharacterized membrane protein YdbT with pleckstrin-like domain
MQLGIWALRQTAAIFGILLALGFWTKGAPRYVADDVKLVINVVETVGLGVFFLQLPFTFMLVRLDWEMRWYIVTDRSLRIRTGILRVHEATLTFANIQQITVLQGPLQRLLGISDLHVTTAGGGSSGGHPTHGQQQHSMHQGFFHGIANATEVREMILQRLRQYRDTGLGDPDEPHAALPPSEASPASPNSELLDAARELLAETRAANAAARRIG